jgi:hypothetical protein
MSAGDISATASEDVKMILVLISGFFGSAISLA